MQNRVIVFPKAQAKTWAFCFSPRYFMSIC